MRQFTILAILVLVCATIAHAQETAPVLNIIGHAEPRQVVAYQEVTYVADIYSTSEVTETMHLVATAEPWVRLDVAGILQDTSLGPVDCVPSLVKLDCQIPIKVGYPVSMFVQLQAPNLAKCDPSIALHIAADLPNRHSEAVIQVPITDGTKCTYLPIIDVSNNPQG